MKKTRLQIEQEREKNREKQREQQKKRKLPMRMCVGCREMKPKRELIRVVRAPDGTVSLDESGRKPGRGAYVCRCGDCLKRAIKQRQLERQLEVSLGEELAARLQEMLLTLPPAPPEEPAEP